MTDAPLVRQKWRPKLGLIVRSVLVAVLALPSVLILGIRAFDDEGWRLGVAEIGAIALSLVLTLFVAYVLTRTLTRPIDALIARADEIGRAGRSAIRPLEFYGTREIATLSQSYLDLARRLVDRSDYVRSFATHVSHELKSPLTAIKGAAELLRDEAVEMSPAERQRFLDNIVADADRLRVLLGRLRELAQAELPRSPGRSTLSQILPELLRRQAQLELIITSGADIALPLPADAAAMAFGHIADNAHQNGASRLSIAAEQDETGISIRLADDGPGIAAGDRERIFQPFFSTRREQGGTGLGLEITRAALNSHGCMIELMPSPAGAAFLIRMPKVS